MRYASNVLVYLGLSIWIGGLAVFGAVVAPVLFGGTLPRTLAGAINSSILSRLGTLEIVAGVILVGGLFYAAIRVGSWMNWTALVIGLVMLATAAYYTAVLFPKVNRIRVEIGSFESIAAEKQELKAEFDRGHQLYSTLVKGVLLGAIIVLVLHTTSLVRNGARRERQTRLSPELRTDPAPMHERGSIERTRPSAARS